MGLVDPPSKGSVGKRQKRNAASQMRRSQNVKSLAEQLINMDDYVGEEGDYDTKHDFPNKIFNPAALNLNKLRKS